MFIEQIVKAVVPFLQQNIHMPLLIALATGFYLGRLSFRGFCIGSTTATLVAALLLGQLPLETASLTTIKTISFSLFIFMVGYTVGPDLMHSLKKNGGKYLIITFIFAAIALLTALLLGNHFHFDQGTTVGLMSGSLTQSSIIGTAENALRSIANTEQYNTLIAHIAIAHALTYIFGFAGVTLFYKLIPILFGIDLKKSAAPQKKKLEKKQQSTKKNLPSYIVMIALGCIMGSIIGLVRIPLGSFSLTIGSGAGTLLIGLLFGLLNKKKSLFEDVPTSVSWLVTFGSLNTFIACIGLTAAPQAIHALQTYGAQLFFAGVLVALAPHITSILVGRFILKIPYCLLLGAVAGAGTVTPALQVLLEEAGHDEPALGYTVPYALSNFILTMLGPLVVYLM